MRIRSSLSLNSASKSVVCAGSTATMRARVTATQQQVQQPEKQQPELVNHSLSRRASRLDSTQRYHSGSTCVQRAVVAPCLPPRSRTCLRSVMSVCVTPASALSCALLGQGHLHVRWGMLCCTCNATCSVILLNLNQYAGLHMTSVGLVCSLTCSWCCLLMANTHTLLAAFVDTTPSPMNSLRL